MPDSLSPCSMGLPPMAIKYSEHHLDLHWLVGHGVAVEEPGRNPARGYVVGLFEMEGLCDLTGQYCQPIEDGKVIYHNADVCIEGGGSTNG